MNFKNSFNCGNCPKKSGEEGCVCWVGNVVETNIVTGDERIINECLFQAMPRWFTLTIQASNRPAAAFESARNEIVRAIGQATEIQRMIER